MPDAQYRVKVGDAEYLVTAPDPNTAWQWANMTHAQSAKGAPAAQPKPAQTAQAPSGGTDLNAPLKEVEAPGILGLFTDPKGWSKKTEEYNRYIQQKIQRQDIKDIQTQTGFFDRLGDFFKRGELNARSGVQDIKAAIESDPVLKKQYQAEARKFAVDANMPIADEATWEEVKKDWFKVLPYVLEQGAQSLPQMLVGRLSPLGLGLTTAGTAGQVARGRAEADDRQDVSGSDAAIGLPVGMASAFLDQFGLGEIVGTAGKNALIRTLKAAGAEAGTEGIQNTLEYLGSRIGTKKGASAAEAFDQALAGAVAGGGMGAGLRGTGEAVSAAGKKVASARENALERRAAEERRAATFTDAEAEIGTEYNKAYAEFRRQGMSEREAMVAASTAVQPIMDRLRKQQETSRSDQQPDVEEPTATTVDTEQATAEVPEETPTAEEPAPEPTPAPLVEPTKKAVNKAARQIDADLTLFGDDIEGEFGTRQLTPEQRMQAARMIAADPNIAPIDAIGSILQTAQRTAPAEQAVEPSTEGVRTVQEATAGITPQSYVDRYLAGEGRGNTPADLELQQYAANNPQEIEAEFAKRKQQGEPAATTKAQEFIDKRRAELAVQEAADKQAEAKLREEIAARDEVPEPQFAEEPAPVEEPQTVADTAVAEEPAPASFDEVMQNPMLYARQQAEQQGLDAPMFAEGARDVMQGREPLTEEQITAAQGPEFAAAYMAGMQWAKSLQPQQEVAAEQAVPEQQVQGAERDEYDQVLEEIEDLMYDADGNPAPQIDEKAYNLLTSAAEAKRVPVEKIREEMEKAQTRFAEQGVGSMYRQGPVGEGVSAAEVEDHVGRIVDGWKANVPVRVVESLDELPDTLRSAVEADGAQSAQGFVSPDGTVYIMSQNLDTLDEATATLYHEALGHMGLRALFGERLDRVLQGIYDGNKNLREQADRWLKDNPNAYPNTANPKLRALEEVLAEQSEAGRVDASLWAKVVAVVKDFGRRIGLGSDFSDSEVRAILAMAHDRITKRGARGAPESNAYARKVKKERANIRKLRETLATSHKAAEMNKTAGELFFDARGVKGASAVLSAGWQTMSNKGRRTALKFFYFNHDIIRGVAKLSPPIANKLRVTNEAIRRMSGTRNRMMRSVSYNAARWTKFNVKFKEGGKLLADLINGSTLVQVDPRHATLADAIANDRQMQDLIQKGAGKRTIKDREETIKYIYNLWEQLADPKNGKGEGRRLYQMAMSAYQRSFDREFQLTIQSIRDSGLSVVKQREAINQITKIYNDAKKISPYAPLNRQGDFWVRIGKGKNRTSYRLDGETAWIDTINQTVRALQESGDTRSKDEILADPSTIAFGREVEGLESDFFANEPSALLKRVFDTLDTSGVSDVRAVKDLVFQMYIASLPVNATSKRLAHREGVRGFSADVLRAYVDSQTNSINRYARLSHARDIRNAIGSAYALLEGSPNRMALEPYVEEMALRAADVIAPQGNSLNALAAFGNKVTYFYLLTSIKSMLVQALHLPTVGLATLGARYGWGNAVAISARYGATLANKLGTSKLDENGNVITNWGEPRMGDSKYINEHPDPEMREALKYAWEDAVDRNILDTTYSGEMLSMKTEPSDQYKSPLRRAARTTFGFITGGMHHLERISRELMFMASFEMEYKKRRAESIQPDIARAMASEAAADTTLEAMFDYAEDSKPRSFKHPIGKLAFQFFTFPVQMVSMLTRNFFNMISLMPSMQERVIAAKQFFGTIGMVWLFAGVVGMPGYSLMMGLMEGLRDSMREVFGGDDDDDEYADDEHNPLAKINLDLWFRERFLPEYFGPDSSIARAMGLNKEQAEKLTRAVKMGPISAATDLDFGSSMSLDGLFFRDDTSSDTTKEATKNLVYSVALGATGSVIERFANGVDYIGKGDWQRAAESFSPAWLRGAVVANRLNNEGNITTKGAVVKDREWYTTGKLLAQKAGFGSTEVADIQRSNTLARKVIEGIEKERTKLADKFDRAYQQAIRNPTEKNQEAYRAMFKEMADFDKRTGYVHPLMSEALTTSLEERTKGRASAIDGLQVDDRYQPYVRDIVDR